MKNAPSPNGTNGLVRNPAGRFAPGNAGGPGNPHAKRSAEIRSLIYRTVSDDDLQAIIASLVQQAKAGDLPAAREVLDRCMGRPPQGLYESDETGRAAAVKVIVREMRQGGGAAGQAIDRTPE